MAKKKVKKNVTGSLQSDAVFVINMTLETTVTTLAYTNTNSVLETTFLLLVPVAPSTLLLSKYLGKLTQ